MKPKIAIPVPHSGKPEYNQRSLPQYIHAIEASGGEAVQIPLDLSNDELAKLISRCDAVVLPGSPADVDPQKFGATKHPKTNPADSARDNVDELLIQDAYNLHKPLLGICYGLQSLNVWRTGSLVQHIESPVNHEAGRQIRFAHDAKLEPASRLAKIIGQFARNAALRVNSSHHQAAERPGDGLHVVATCAQDGIIEAIEGSDPKHFVIGVQWHPERGFDEDPASQSLFRALVEEATKSARQRNA